MPEWTRERWSQVDALFDAALDVPDDERAGWLDNACAGDAELRLAVQRLLDLSGDGDDGVRPEGAMVGTLWDEVAGELGVAARSAPLEVGSRLGRYEIQEAIGAGGFGEVYRAKDTRLDRTVAVKILPAHIAIEPRARERFEREAQAAGSLSHPHVCAVYDIDHQWRTAVTTGVSVWWADEPKGVTTINLSEHGWREPGED